MALKAILVACINNHCHPVCLCPDEVKLGQGDDWGKGNNEIQNVRLLKYYDSLSSIRLILELHAPLPMKFCIWSPSCTLKFNRYWRSAYYVPGTELGGGHLTSDKVDKAAAVMEPTFWWGSQTSNKETNKWTRSFQGEGGRRKCKEGKKYSEMMEHKVGRQTVRRDLKVNKELPHEGLGEG